MDSVVTSAWLISWYVDVLIIYLGKWSTLTIMYILLIFLSLLLLLLILSFVWLLMFSGGWLQAIVTHWSVPVRFEQLSCHHHKTLSKFLVQPPYPPKKTKQCCVLLHCKICRIRTARFLAAFQWFISYIFGTKLFIFKGCRYDPQSSPSKKQGHLWISLNGAPCPSSFIEPLLHNHRHPKCFWMFGRLASFLVIKELKICHALLIKDIWPQFNLWSDEG